MRIAEKEETTSETKAQMGNNTEMALQEVGFEVVGEVQVAQDIAERTPMITQSGRLRYLLS